MNMAFKYCVFAAGLSVATVSAVYAEELLTRDVLHTADLSYAEDAEVITAYMEIKPGGVIPLHTHHGDEHVIVLQGTTLERADGTQVEFPTGIALSFARGVVHGGFTVVGDAALQINTIHIVDKGKPLMVPAE